MDPASVQPTVFQVGDSGGQVATDPPAEQSSGDPLNDPSGNTDPIDETDGGTPPDTGTGTNPDAVPSQRPASTATPDAWVDVARALAASKPILPGPAPDNHPSGGDFVTEVQSPDLAPVVTTPLETSVLVPAVHPALAASGERGAPSAEGSLWRSALCAPRSALRARGGVRAGH